MALAAVGAFGVALAPQVTAQGKGTPGGKGTPLKAPVHIDAAAGRRVVVINAEPDRTSVLFTSRERHPDGGELAITAGAEKAMVGLRTRDGGEAFLTAKPEEGGLYFANRAGLGGTLTAEGKCGKLLLFEGRTTVFEAPVEE